MKLGLGTVQFGTDYGISNQSGQTSPVEVAKILQFAAANGITYLDTAPAYGNSETVLGEILAADHQFRIVTKTNKIGKSQITDEDVQLVLEIFEQSLNRLQQKSVYGLLVHHPDDLLSEGGDRLMASLDLLKKRGLVEKIGVSVYDQLEIDRLLAQYSIDLIQIPLSVFDQRLLKDGYLSSLKSQGVEIHARSVFLQGILLMTEAELPSYVQALMPNLQRYRQQNQLLSITSLQAAVGFVDQLPAVDTILVGVNNLSQLIEIVSAVRENFDLDYLQACAVENEALVNPALWNR